LACRRAELAKWPNRQMAESGAMAESAAMAAMAELAD
jgi:hypothetical protein